MKLILLLLLLIPFELITSEQVDWIERNHYHDQQGRLVFTQVIFWEWNDTDFRVRDFRIERENMQLDPEKIRWMERDYFREVSAETITESWTQYDPEVFDRRFLPQQQRRGLRK